MSENEYVTCPRCEGKGVIPLADLSRYEDAASVAAELRRRLGITAAKARAEQGKMLSAVEWTRRVAVLDDPELAAAVERITGKDLASAAVGLRVMALREVLAS